jgi:hypothetical protein
VTRHHAAHGQVNSRSIAFPLFENWNLLMTANEKRRASNAARAQANAEALTTPLQWQAFLQRIADSREAAAARLREIAEERSTLVLAAHSGDRDASGVLAALNVEAMELVAGVDLANDAEREARRRLAAAEEAEAAEIAREHHRQARGIAHKLEDVALRIDAAAGALKALIDERKELLAELAPHDPDLSRRMGNRSAMAVGAALELAGLPAVAGLRATTAGFRKALTESDCAMLAALLGRSPPERKPSPMPAPLPMPADADGWQRQGSPA